MLIGNKTHTAGAKTRYRVDYREWLDDGRTIAAQNYSAATLAPAPADVTVSNVSVTADDLYFFVQGGSVNETFTVQVQIQDTLGEVVIDTIQFTVVAP